MPAANRPARDVPAVRAVLFDLDGVLIDSHEVWFALLQEAARALGPPGSAVMRADFEAGLGQGIEADIARWFPGRTVPEVEAYYAAHFLDHRAHLRVDPDAADVLAGLRESGVPSAVVTNTPSPLAREILATVGLEIGVVVGGTDVPRPKPAPDIVLRAAELLRVSAADAIVVGDTAFDRDAARTAGVRFAGLGIEGDVALARLRDVLTLAREPGRLCWRRT
jgi:phosphoglycolate phosphatase/AHBA synthesis associated protein